MSPAAPTVCGFMLFDGFSNMVLASAVEPLRAANALSGRRLFEHVLLTVDGRPAVSSSRIAIAPDAAAAAAPPLDALFVVAGYDARAFVVPPVLSALRRLARRTPVLAGLDVGAWLLAAAGLFAGRRATVHWQELENFAEAFPTVTVVADRTVVDGDRMTAGGATTVMELMLRLVRERGGEALAFDVTNMFVYDVAPAGRDGRRAALSLPFARRAPQLERAIAEMRRTAAAPLPLARIADAAATSLRTLERLFPRELGVSPAKYYQMVRLGIARSLVEETGLSAAEIAARTGFASTATLSRAFSGHFGTSIRAVRKGRLATPRERR
ncbi:helix-turn-helix domain-containing protein [Pseudoxanthobacter sp. M-2]|uniref:GlxA family transcriptional regulator n=1 Tax=Pseudoxanthobacter sp. M-2 TaxID=3078754 RepID=UPI0038FCF460